MQKKVFVTAEGRRVEDEAVEVEPAVVSGEELLIWEYEDADLSLKRVILDPQGVRLWKSVNEKDQDGYPLMSFEPGFEAEPRGNDEEE